LPAIVETLQSVRDCEGKQESHQTKDRALNRGKAGHGIGGSLLAVLQAKTPPQMQGEKRTYKNAAATTAAKNRKTISDLQSRPRHYRNSTSFLDLSQFETINDIRSRFRSPVNGHSVPAS